MRTGAQRGHEVSQANEVLTWMESHPLPFACTTNLMSRLDAAALRRFTVKIRMGYLTRDQARAAFRAILGAEPPSGLKALTTLTPGDLVTVRLRAEALGERNPQRLRHAQGRMRHEAGAPAADRLRDEAVRQAGKSEPDVPSYQASCLRRFMPVE